MLYRKLYFDVIVNGQFYQMICNEGCQLSDALMAVNEIKDSLEKQIAQLESVPEDANVG